jgi:hypothetical protein
MEDKKGGKGETTTVSLGKGLKSMAGGTLTGLWTREPVRTRIKWAFFERRPVR